ncbi:MAG TPA: hypothetical protein VNK46_16225 [Nitrospiraceae bacterium]|nr:hypothetical protein [Nitrospiraceae bacterium]
MSDLALARLARARNIPVILDLCDNVFVDGYESHAKVITAQLASLASVIVTATAALADVVKEHVAGPVEVTTIPDPAESVGDARRVLRRFGHRTAIFELREWVAGMKAGRGRECFRLLRLLRMWAREGATALGRRPGSHRDTWPSSGRSLAGHRIVTWFGNHGADHSDFGMLDLLAVAPALEALASRYPIVLRVISNSREKFLRRIAPLNLPTDYRKWSLIRCHEWIRESDVVVVPNSLSEFSVCKSANRALLALSNGVPVVATRTRAMEELEGCVILDDWEKGIEAYLCDGQLREAHVKRAKSIIQERFSGPRIAEKWLEVIERAKTCRNRSDRHAGGRPRVVFLVNLVQDLDLIEPIYQRARQTDDWLAELWVTTFDLCRRRDMYERLRARSLRYEVVDPRRGGSGGFPGWERVVALVSASESSLPPHADAYRAVRRARRLGVRTFTMQHGFENVGLTYSDAEYPADRVRFASDVIFTWGPVSQLHERVQVETRRKCVPVGCPKTTEDESPWLRIPGGRPLVAVFENLHWTRYSEAYRHSFVADLVAVAAELPGVDFLVRPHPAGRWLTGRGGRSVAKLDNLLVADPGSPGWVRISAVHVLRRATAVITTPSTIALDAARLDRPVAVAAYGLDLAAYAPLPVLNGREDWSRFIRGVLEGRSQVWLDLARRFAERTTIGGDAVERILRYVREYALGESDGNLESVLRHTGEST